METSFAGIDTRIEFSFHRTEPTPGDELPDNERIRAQRAAFITQRLQLTTEEATIFWAAYNDHETEKRRIMANFRGNPGYLPATEAEAEALIMERFRMEEELVDLKRRFYLQVKGKVSSKKLAQLPAAETEFKRALLRQLRGRG
ncbi:MAG: hypothetical protein R2795_03690 [Saprospiraceae bacterium]